MDYAGIFLAILICLGYIGMRLYRSKYKPSQVVFSSTNDFINPNPSLKMKWQALPDYLYTLAFLSSLIALSDPHEYVLKNLSGNQPKISPSEGRLIMVVLDQSGSMNEPAFEGRLSAEGLSKIQFIKPILEKFIHERETDLVGLSSFARVVKILSPPTLDHEQIIKEIENLTTVSGNDRDGTAIGYALLKTTHLITSLKEQTGLIGDKAPYTIKGASILLVTDGLQDPNPLDIDNASRSIGVEEAAAFAKDKGVKLYIINVEPKLAEAKYLPNLKQMQRVAEITGGKFFQATSSEDLSEFVNLINKSETGKIRMPSAKALPGEYNRFSYYPILIGIALSLFLVAYTLQMSYFRRVL